MSAAFQHPAVEFDSAASQGKGRRKAPTAIPPIPHPANELRMAAALAELQTIADTQPLWYCSRWVLRVAEVNQLRGLPGPQSAVMDVRWRSLEVRLTLNLEISQMYSSSCRPSFAEACRPRHCMEHDNRTSLTSWHDQSLFR